MLSKNAGGGMVINHGHSVEINASRIGKNFHCFQNVTIGTTNSPIGPTIGDNVLSVPELLLWVTSKLEIM